MDHILPPSPYSLQDSFLIELAKTRVSMEMAMYKAVSDGDRRVVQHLLNIGTDVTFRPLHGYDSTFMRALHLGDHEIIWNIISKYPAVAAATLHTAVSHRNKELVHVLLFHGASPNAKSFEGKTALYLAASQWSDHIVEKLLE